MLELKSAEAADLRHKTMELEEKVSSPSCWQRSSVETNSRSLFFQLKKVKEKNSDMGQLQRRNEDLEALLELRQESEK